MQGLGPMAVARPNPHLWRRLLATSQFPLSINYNGSSASARPPARESHFCIWSRHGVANTVFSTSRLLRLLVYFVLEAIISKLSSVREQASMPLVPRERFESMKKTTPVTLAARSLHRDFLSLFSKSSPEGCRKIRSERHFPLHSLVALSSILSLTTCSLEGA